MRIIIALLALGLAPLAFGQGMGMGMTATFAELDADGDGKISKEEARQSRAGGKARPGFLALGCG